MPGVIWVRQDAVLNACESSRVPGVADDFEFEDVGSTIEVSPTNTTTCDQQVNQAASATG